MTTTKKTASQEPTKDEGGNFVLSALRSGIGVLEKGTVSATELPLSMMSSLGVPSGATDAARKGSVSMLHSVNGTIDTLATQSFKLAGKGASLVTGVVGGKKS
jgi:hypothetical protein